MTRQSFSTFLKLEKEWGIGQRYSTKEWPWLALHFHDGENIGWEWKGHCSHCHATFPNVVKGMRNMMNGFRT